MHIELVGGGIVVSRTKILGLLALHACTLDTMTGNIHERLHQ